MQAPLVDCYFKYLVFKCFWCFGEKLTRDWMALLLFPFKIMKYRFPLSKNL